MSTTTMHFGPEWMRTKHQAPSRSQQPPSPPPTNAPLSAASTYSALVSPAPPSQPEKRDEVHPFRYTKEELLKIYKEGGGKGGLGLEVERWEGVVREVGSEPVGLREMGESEKKLFAGPLNSDLRRRQSTDYLSPLSTQSLGTERSRLNPASGTASPLRERFGALRRRDSTDQSTVTIPRKQSLSSLQPPLMSPRDTTMSSPRTRVGYTSNFDGVLNNGDSWVARRRASEASMKSGVGTSRDGGEQGDGKASEIREEDEGGNFGPLNGPGDNKFPTTQPELAGHADRPIYQDGPNAVVDVSRLSLDAYNTNVHDSLGAVDAGPPPGIPDLASIEWSYKDPQGNIQGPFRADLMQKWYDEGYFTPDLPMKRTTLDTQWTSVEDLIRRSGGGKLFLTLPSPAIPPGLSHRTESPLPNFASDQHLFNGPYQPAPLRTLRSTTLDSFGSNPSDSPSSSFGGGRFGSDSPDPNAFGGRGYFGDTPIGGRLASFGGMPDPGTAFGSRRAAFNDASMDPSLGIRGQPVYPNINNRVPTDSYGYNRAYSPGQGPWNNTSANAHPTFDANRSSTDPSTYSHFGPTPTNGFNNLRPQDNIFGENTYQQPLDYSTYNGLNGGSSALPQQYSQSPTTQYTAPHQLQQPAALNVYGQHGIVPDAISNSPQPINHLSNSAWNEESPSSRRPGPFDAPHPTSTNTMVVQPVSAPDASPWGHTSQPSRPESRTNESSPWGGASQSALEENWKEVPPPDSLTFSNVGQHNQQQQSTADVNGSLKPVSPIEQSPPLPEPTQAPLPIEVAPPTTKTKSKGTTQANQASAKFVAPTPTLPVVATPSPPPPAAPKAAWAKEDEVAKSSGVSISLREIQEAEAKKAEARKAAERERERAARAVTSETKEDAQPFTASWGLPTSQAGVRSSVPSKETPTSPSPPTQAVWTTAAKPPTTKKTMKEIQEEEERRKKVAIKETTAAAAARRTYVETTNKVVIPSASTPTNAWTTVGPSGKTSTLVASPARPAVVPSSSTLNVPSSSSPRVNGNIVTPRTASVSSVKPTPIPPAPKFDDPVSPSHEFLKWLNESLKGLNSSVNVEEIMAMLLSFSMDPDPSTVELISELIYANSTTLDGRRFAAEFISKRKADAASRPKGSSASGRAPVKPISIADVVKATPKPAQPEWGFKVVNKKKKGGRV